MVWKIWTKAEANESISVGPTSSAKIAKYLTKN